jgi:hypothetical protein
MCHSYQIWTLHVGNEICDLLCGLKQSSIVIWIDVEAFVSVSFLSSDLKAGLIFNNSIVFGKFLSAQEAIKSSKRSIIDLFFTKNIAPFNNNIA